MDWLMSLSSIWSILDTAWTILLVVIGFTAVIFVHELGHFLMAKRVGIRVDKFAIGFGRRLFGIRRGETDYCVNALPVGGYVKMAGQEDFELEKAATPDPRAFNNKSVGARALVVSAGVAMNVIFAAVLFMAVFLLGVDFAPNRVGSARFGSPAYGRIVPGSEVLKIGEDETEDFNSVRVAVALSGAGRDCPLSVTVKEPDGAVRTVELTPTADNREGLLAIGIEPESTLRIAADLDAEGAEQLKKLPVEGELRPGDRIVRAACGGATVPVEFYSDLVRLARAGAGQPLRVAIERKEGDGTATAEAVLRTYLPGVEAGPKLNLLGAHVPMRVGLIEPDRPAAGIVQEGDILVRVGPQDYPHFQQFGAACAASVGKPLPMVVLRDGQRLAVQVTPAHRWREKRVMIGIGIKLLDDRALVGQVDADSPLGRAGLKPGSILLGVYGPDQSPPPAPTSVPASQAMEEALSWSAACTAFVANAGRRVVLRAAVEEAVEDLKVDVPPTDQPATAGASAGPTWPDWFIFNPPPLPVAPLEATYSAGGNPLRATAMGVQKTWQFILLNYLTLRRLATPDSGIGVKDLSGPVFIAYMSYQFAKAGVVKLLYFLALLSVALAVFNFLPLPVMDGGLMVFLLIEKIRRKPVPLIVVHVSQVIGLVLIVGLALLVTYNDIWRLIHG